MVAIPHGKGQPLFFQRAGRFLDLRVLRAVHAPAADVPAALHQIEIVQQFKRIAPRVQRLDERAARIVRQEHGVRRFQRRVFPDLYARRDALQDRALRGADARRAAGPVIVGRQVDFRHQPQAFAVEVSRSTST